jgi:hypothetical protein
VPETHSTFSPTKWFSEMLVEKASLICPVRATIRKGRTYAGTGMLLLGHEFYETGLLSVSTL